MAHNLELIAEADWVIDLGAEGGERGAASSPKALPSTSPHFLRELLERSKRRRSKS